MTGLYEAEKLNEEAVDEGLKAPELQDFREEVERELAEELSENSEDDEEIVEDDDLEEDSEDEEIIEDESEEDEGEEEPSPQCACRGDPHR